MFTDASFQYCTHETINYLVQYGVTVYQYILTYEGKYSFSTLDGVPVGTGVTHGDDLFYLWDMPYLTDLGYNIGKIKDGYNRGHGFSAAIKLESLEKTVGASLNTLWFVLSSPFL